ncbi:MAG: hypothetical protein R3D71_03225 [Rickettsiales bacterium]
MSEGNKKPSDFIKKIKGFINKEKDVDPKEGLLINNKQGISYPIDFVRQSTFHLRTNDSELLALKQKMEKISEITANIIWTDKESTKLLWSTEKDVIKKQIKGLPNDLREAASEVDKHWKILKESINTHINNNPEMFLGVSGSSVKEGMLDAFNKKKETLAAFSKLADDIEQNQDRYLQIFGIGDKPKTAGR